MTVCCPNNCDKSFFCSHRACAERSTAFRQRFTTQQAAARSPVRKPPARRTKHARPRQTKGGRRPRTCGRRRRAHRTHPRAARTRNSPPHERDDLHAARDRHVRRRRWSDSGARSQHHRVSRAVDDPAAALQRPDEVRARRLRPSRPRPEVEALGGPEDVVVLPPPRRQVRERSPVHRQGRRRERDPRSRPGHGVPGTRQHQGRAVGPRDRRLRGPLQDRQPEARSCRIRSSSRR